MNPNTATTLMLVKIIVSVLATKKALCVWEAEKLPTKQQRDTVLL